MSNHCLKCDKSIDENCQEYRCPNFDKQCSEKPKDVDPAEEKRAGNKQIFSTPPKFGRSRIK